MKLAEVVPGIVKTHGVDEVTQFKIEPNIKAFRALMKSLYPDKIKAPIRELSTNAVDAHIDAGTSHKKFQVTLPTLDDPMFTIRDFGTGMDQEKLKGLYITLFASDKDTSDDKNGCWGLGSKSPFAYSNSFYVTSYYEGTIYSYVASLNGKPDFHFHGSAPTDEPNGMRIGFAVEPGDINEFHTTARDIYKYFKHKPEITGGEISFPETEFFLEGNGWAIEKDGTSSSSLAVMANIAYPIVASHFRYKPPAEEVNPNIHPNAPARYNSARNYGGYHEDTKYQKLLALKLHLDFPTGAVEITPSREDLQYTTKTVDAIKAKLDIVEAEIVEKMSQKFDSCTNLYEARRMFADIMREGAYGLRAILETAPPKYKGVSLDQKDIVLRDAYQCINNADGTDMTYLSYQSSGRISKQNNQNTIPIYGTAYDNFAFVEDDMERGAYAASRRHILDHTNPVKRIYLLRFASDTARKTFCDLMGFDESYIIKASSFPKLERIKRGPRLEKVFKFQKGAWGNLNNFWATADVDIEDGGIFIETSRNNCVLRPGSIVCTRNIQRVVEKFEALGLTIPEIIGLKTSIVGKYRDTDKGDWTELYVYLTEKLEEYVLKENIAQAISDVKTYNSFSNSTKYVSLRNTKVQPKEGSDYAEFLVKVKKLEKNFTAKKDICNKVLDIATTLGYNIQGVVEEDLDKEVDALEAKYEVLQLVEKYGIYSDKASLVAKLINKQIELENGNG